MRLKKLWRKHGMDDHEMVDKAGMHKHVQSDVYLGGMIDHTGGHMYPLNLALEKPPPSNRSAALFPVAPVISVTQGAKPSVKTAKGEMRCTNACAVATLIWVTSFRTDLAHHAILDTGYGDRAGYAPNACCPTIFVSRTCATSSTTTASGGRERLLFGGGTAQAAPIPQTSKPNCGAIWTKCSRS